ncbi:hypothetical protein DFH09DRAFT_1327182 [Mycena vulgaris]|nr:hypothetical protein DFH09DRAFT_1327182 [Mycena vulgaris]
MLYWRAQRRCCAFASSAPYTTSSLPPTCIPAIHPRYSMASPPIPYATPPSAAVAPSRSRRPAPECGGVVRWRAPDFDCALRRRRPHVSSAWDSAECGVLRPLAFPSLCPGLAFTFENACIVAAVLRPTPPVRPVRLFSHSPALPTSSPDHILPIRGPNAPPAGICFCNQCFPVPRHQV